MGLPESAEELGEQPVGLQVRSSGLLFLLVLFIQLLLLQHSTKPGELCSLLQPFLLSFSPYLSLALKISGFVLFFFLISHLLKGIQK